MDQCLLIEQLLNKLILIRSESPSEAKKKTSKCMNSPRAVTLSVSCIPNERVKDKKTVSRWINLVPVAESRAGVSVGASMSTSIHYVGAHGVTPSLCRFHHTYVWMAPERPAGTVNTCVRRAPQSFILMTTSIISLL